MQIIPNFKKLLEKKMDKTMTPTFETITMANSMAKLISSNTEPLTVKAVINGASKYIHLVDDFGYSVYMDNTEIALTDSGGTVLTAIVSGYCCKKSYDICDIALDFYLKTGYGTKGSAEYTLCNISELLGTFGIRAVSWMPVQSSVEVFVRKKVLADHSSDSMLGHYKPDIYEQIRTINGVTKWTSETEERITGLHFDTYGRVGYKHTVDSGIAWQYLATTCPQNGIFNDILNCGNVLRITIDNATYKNNMGV